MKIYGEELHGTYVVTIIKDDGNIREEWKIN
jgi:hypothetical protein